MAIRLVLAVVIALGFTACTQGSVLYDATDNVYHSVVNGANPDGVWSYGYTGVGTSTDTALHLHTAALQNSTHPTLFTWHSPTNDGGWGPGLDYNCTDNVTFVDYSTTWTPKLLSIAGNAADKASVVAWTAPTSGVYDVSATFTALQSTMVDRTGACFVTLNGTQSNLGLVNVGTLSVSNTSITRTYNSISLHVGDIVAFGAGAGDMGTGLVATVSEAVPEPTSIILAVTGAIGLLAYAWRMRK